MWQHTINTALLNFSGAAATPNAMLGYTSNPAPGNMYFSLSAGGGTDAFGNTFPTGLSVQSGQVQGVSLIGTSMDSTSTLTGTSIQSPQVLTPNINGGTASGLVHVITTSGGGVLGYTVGTSAVTFATNGVYHWTCPTGVSSVRVQCWGAGAGGNGAITESNGEEGGPGAGAGEYAEEPHYPVVPGLVYQVVVGQGGLPGSLTQAGSDGMPTLFYPTGGAGAAVQANQGLANGTGGSGSINSIHFNGGNGAGSNGGLGGGGGGSSAGPAAQGNQGSGASGSTGGAGGTAVSGGGAGGAGGNNTANGSNASAPGGGGGGGGAATSANSQVLSYEATASASYYGSDAPSNINQRRVINGIIYQGGETASGGSVNGTQKSLFSFPQTQIQSDWTGWTINSCTLWITNVHSWYNSGMTVLIGTYNATTTPPAIWNGSGSTTVVTADIAEGVRHGFGLGATVGKQFAAQSSPTIYMIAFGPGPAFDLNYYGYFNGTPNNGNGPVLTIAGTPIGATGGTGGSGADGQVIITYPGSSPQVTLSVSTTTTTDSFGNTVPTGVYVGNPASNTPQVALVPSAGGPGSAAAVMFPLGPATFFSNQPNIAAESPSSNGELFISGPALSQSGFTDWVQTAYWSFTGSTPAHLDSTYIDSTGAAHTYISVNQKGALLTAGNIVGVVPGTGTSQSNPASAESWHSASLLNSWTAAGGKIPPGLRYRWIPWGANGAIEIDADLVGPAGVTGNSICAQLPGGASPAGYVPIYDHNFVAGWGATGTTNPPWVFIDHTTGNIQVTGIGTAGQEIFFHIIVPVD